MINVETKTTPTFFWYGNTVPEILSIGTIIILTILIIVIMLLVMDYIALSVKVQIK